MAALVPFSSTRQKTPSPITTVIPSTLTVVDQICQANSGENVSFQTLLSFGQQFDLNIASAKTVSLLLETEACDVKRQQCVALFQRHWVANNGGIPMPQRRAIPRTPPDPIQRLDQPLSLTLTTEIVALPGSPCYREYYAVKHQSSGKVRYGSGKQAQPQPLNQAGRGMADPQK